MRIISGIRKGKRLTAPSSLPVRPTTDFAKEALFNILNNHFDFEDVTVLDLFAGTGNISYEFASRGALDIISVDSNQACINFIQKTASSLEFHQIKAIRADALQFISRYKMSADIIFADPPFDFERVNEIPEIVFQNHLLKPQGLLVVEHSIKTSMSAHVNFVEVRKYGSVCFSFFKENDLNP